MRRDTRAWRRKSPEGARIVRSVPVRSGIKTRTLRFTEHDLIVYKKPRDMTKEDFTTFLKAAAQDILARYGIDMIVVGVSSWDELRLMTPDQLEDLGLVKRDEVFLYRKDVEALGHTGEDIMALIELYKSAGEEE